MVLNLLERAKAERVAKGLALIDLSDGNPTSHRLMIDWQHLATGFVDYLKARTYEPDARGLIAARDSIAQYYQERSSTCDITPDSIIIISSTSEAYNLLLTLLCKPGDSVLEPCISYPLFELIAENHGLKRHFYSFSPKTSEAALDSSREALNHAQLMFSISPHNPTGKIVELKNSRIADSRIPLIVDEVFSEFHIPGHSVPIVGELFPENPVFHLNGISKMCGLPDFKIGWIAMNTCAKNAFAERLEFLNDIFLNASYPIQSLMPAILKQRSEYLSLAMSRITENLEIFLGLTKNVRQIECEPYRAGTTLFPRISIRGDADHFLLALIERGVYVHPGYFYNWEGDFRVVVSLLLEPDRFTQALREVCHLVSEHD